MKKILLVLAILLAIIPINTKASYELSQHEERRGLLALGPRVKLEPVHIYKKDYTDYDLEMLAHVINAEGGGASYVSDEMCYYIGSVVLNRIESKEFPNTMYGVITQPGQYSCYGNPNWNVPVNDRSMQIAQELLDEGTKLPDNVVFQAQFTQGSGVCQQLPIMTGGYMYFCYR